MVARQPLRFVIENVAQAGENITIAAWDFGGTGNPIALLHHANGFCGGTWALVADQLTDHYHVIAIDARGHGDSGNAEVPFEWDYFVSDLLAVASDILSASRYEQIEFGIGSSMGGIVTAAAQARQPGLFKRLALLDPPIHPTAALVARLQLNLEPVDPMKGALVEQTLKRRTSWPTLDGPRKSWRDKGMFAAWSEEAFELYLAECLHQSEDGSVNLKCDPRVEAHIFETTGSLDVMQYAPYVDAPVLYLRAEAGDVPGPFCEGVASLFGNCQYEEISAGHLLPLEVPELVAGRLLKFAADTATD